MGALSPEERPVIGSLVNEVRDELNKLFENKEAEFKKLNYKKKIINRKYWCYRTKQKK